MMDRMRPDAVAGPSNEGAATVLFHVFSECIADLDTSDDRGT